MIFRLWWTELGNFLHLQQCVMWVGLVSVMLWSYYRITYTPHSETRLIHFRRSDLSQADHACSSCSCPSCTIVFGHLQTPKWCVRVQPLMQKCPGFWRRSLQVIRLIRLETSVPFVIMCYEMLMTYCNIYFHSAHELLCWCSFLLLNKLWVWRSILMTKQVRSSFEVIMHS